MTTNIYNKSKKYSYMRKLLLVLTLCFLFAIPQLSALENQPTVKQGECIDIAQVCASCSYVNISSISNRENATILNNVPMSSIGNGEWRYEFCNTTFLGRYDVRGQGDINGIDKSFAAFFNVTPSGESGTENLIFIIFLIVAIYTITFLGFFRHNATITLVGGMAMIFLGIYLINNGIIIYRDNLTNYFAYLTSLLGGGLSIMATISLIDE